MAPIFLVLVKYLREMQGAYHFASLVKVTESDKHSSLPMYGINCDRKSF